jgi:hypothetical protein
MNFDGISDSVSLTVRIVYELVMNQKFIQKMKLWIGENIGCHLLARSKARLMILNYDKKCIH